MMAENISRSEIAARENCGSQSQERRGRKKYINFTIAHSVKRASEKARKEPLIHTRTTIYLF